jgi:TetR/AcrR family transcriptional repressor of nem operon
MISIAFVSMIGEHTAEIVVDGELAKRLDASELALMLIAVVQGGFVVSRVYRDRNAINRSTEMAKSLLKSLPRR